MKKFNGLIILLTFFNLIVGKEFISTKEKIVSEKFFLVGNYYEPKDGKPIIVLLHGLGSIRQEWDKLTKILIEQGFGYFSFDLRGHGESIETVSGKQVLVNEFKKVGQGSEWEKMVTDLDVVIKYLVKEKKVKEENIILCGASLGANICLIYATKNPHVKNLILLSPGWEYVGLKLEEPAKKVAVKSSNILFCASPRDAYSYSSTRQIMKIMKSFGQEATFLEGKDAQHGVEMFEKKFLDDLIFWINSLIK